ncbi:MAG TPA: type III secretion system export apparatus subunit SctR [Cedecea sp.]
MNITLSLAILSLLPTLMIVSTSFLKIAIVLFITRNALGIQQIPPNIVLYSITLAATMFIMAPTFNDVSDRLSLMPLDTHSLESTKSTASHAIEPVKKFMQSHSDKEIVQQFRRTAVMLWPVKMKTEINDENILLITPAFVLSELQSAFKIGFLIYIPFFVIDLVISNVLLVMGMQMVSPMTLAIPIKILLFISVDGWGRLLNSLFSSYMQRN